MKKTSPRFCEGGAYFSTFGPFSLNSEIFTDEVFEVEGKAVGSTPLTHPNYKVQT